MNDEYDNESIETTDDDAEYISIVPHTINHDDCIDFDYDVFIWLDEYLHSNILKLSNPNFYNTMLEDITIIVYQYLEDACIVSEEDYPLVREYIDSMQSTFLDICQVPYRSIRYTTPILTIECDTNRARYSEITNKINRLRIKDKNLPKQKTKEWYEARYNLLTASSISKIFASQSQMNSIIYEKCKPFEEPTESNYCNTLTPMHWGVKYEPVTVMVYESTFQTQVEDFGCIPHETYACIGASPDGINVDPNNTRLYGRMLEIKNIFNREITGVPKEEYWVQTQIQMETCDLEECDFVETRFKEFANENEFYSDDQHEYKGVILQFIQRTNANGKLIYGNAEVVNNAPVYKYMPLSIPLTRDAVTDWINETKLGNREKYVLLETQYWYLDEFSCVLIPRNRYWFAEAAPVIEDTWKTIELERLTGYSHRSPQKRRTNSKVEVVSETQTTSYTIRNLEMGKPVCLIKLSGEP